MLLPDFDKLSLLRMAVKDNVADAMNMLWLLCNHCLVARQPLSGC